MREILYRRLLNDASLRSLALKLTGEKHEDLIQEIALVICEKDDEQLMKLNDYFNFWVVRTMINMASKRGVMKKYHERNPSECIESIEVENEDYDHSIDELLEKINNELSKMYWYDRRLFEQHAKGEKLREISRQSGIPLTSIAGTVKGVKERLRRCRQ